MKSKEEIENKRIELIKEYTKLWSQGKKDTPECNLVYEQSRLLEWVMDMKFMTIHEDKKPLTKEVNQTSSPKIMIPLPPRDRVLKEGQEPIKPKGFDEKYYS